MTCARERQRTATRSDREFGSSSRRRGAGFYRSCISPCRPEDAGNCASSLLSSFFLSLPPPLPPPPRRSRDALASDAGRSRSRERSPRRNEIRRCRYHRLSKIIWRDSDATHEGSCRRDWSPGAGDVGRKGASGAPPERTERMEGTSLQGAARDQVFNITMLSGQETGPSSSYPRLLSPTR